MTTWHRSERLAQIIWSNTSDEWLVYAGLFAECQASAQELANLLNESVWHDAMAREMYLINDRLGQPGTKAAAVAIEALVRLGVPDGPTGLVRGRGLDSAR